MLLIKTFTRSFSGVVSPLPGLLHTFKEHGLLFLSALSADLASLIKTQHTEKVHYQSLVLVSDQLQIRSLLGTVQRRVSHGSSHKHKLEKSCACLDLAECQGPARQLNYKHTLGKTTAHLCSHANTRASPLLKGSRIHCYIKTTNALTFR